ITTCAVWSTTGLVARAGELAGALAAGLAAGFAFDGCGFAAKFSYWAQMNRPTAKSNRTTKGRIRINKVTPLIPVAQKTSGFFARIRQKRSPWPKTFWQRDGFKVNNGNVTTDPTHLCSGAFRLTRSLRDGSQSRDKEHEQDL